MSNDPVSGGKFATTVLHPAEAKPWGGWVVGGGFLGRIRPEYGLYGRRAFALLLSSLPSKA